MTDILVTVLVCAKLMCRSSLAEDIKKMWVVDDKTLGIYMMGYKFMATVDGLLDRSMHVCVHVCCRYMFVVDVLSSRSSLYVEAESNRPAR